MVLRTGGRRELPKNGKNMTKPTTPTGQRLWPKGPVPEYMRDIARETRTNILAIEAEAVAGARERLLEKVRQERTRIMHRRGSGCDCPWDRLIGSSPTRTTTDSHGTCWLRGQIRPKAKRALPALLCCQLLGFTVRRLRRAPARC